MVRGRPGGRLRRTGMILSGVLRSGVYFSVIGRTFFHWCCSLIIDVDL